jgi:hypothetical protein
VKRIVLVGLLVLAGATLGCSGSSSDDQPKNSNPNAQPKIQRSTTGGGATKTQGALKD